MLVSVFGNLSGERPRIPGAPGPSPRLFFRPLSNFPIPERHCHSEGINAPRQPAQENTMQYMLLIFRDEAGMQSASKEDVNQMMAAYMAYTEAMRKAGVMTAGDRLQPAASATTVRVKGGKTEVLNGPYAETKEQLGGYYIIDVPDLDSALSWAARCPGASHGTMEVRPIWTH